MDKEVKEVNVAELERRKRKCRYGVNRKTHRCLKSPRKR